MVKELVALGVAPQTAAKFVASTAAPIPQTSENGKGQSGGTGVTATTTYRTVDGGTLTEAQLQAMISSSLAANPQAAGSNGTAFTGDFYDATGMPKGGGPGVDPTTPKLDWHAYLTNWGFDEDIVNNLDKIFSSYQDANQAQAAALAYIRGTDWYSRTFPGIQAGERLGLVNDEAGYRSYVNQLNQFYQRYYGRDVTTGEINDFLQQGKNPNQVDAHLQGQQYIAANRNDFQYELGAFDPHGQASEAELGALGDQQAGLDNAVGPGVQARIDAAKQKMARIFQGTLASPSMSVLGTGRLASGPGSTTRTPDIQS